MLVEALKYSEFVLIMKPVHALQIKKDAVFNRAVLQK